MDKLKIHVKYLKQIGVESLHLETKYATLIDKIDPQLKIIPLFTTAYINEPHCSLKCFVSSSTCNLQISKMISHEVSWI